MSMVVMSFEKILRDAINIISGTDALSEYRKWIEKWSDGDIVSRKSRTAYNLGTKAMQQYRDINDTKNKYCLGLIGHLALCAEYLAKLNTINAKAVIEKEFIDQTIPCFPNISSRKWKNAKEIYEFKYENELEKVNRSLEQTKEIMER